MLCLTIQFQKAPSNVCMTFRLQGYVDLLYHNGGKVTNKKRHEEISLLFFEDDFLYIIIFPMYTSLKVRDFALRKKEINVSPSTSKVGNSSGAGKQHRLWGSHQERAERLFPWHTTQSLAGVVSGNRHIA